MQKIFFIIIFVAFVTIQGCKSDKNKSNAASEVAYPALPDTLRDRLIKECTQIEYLFSQGFSATTSSKSAVVDAVNHTDNRPVPKKLLSQCPRIGRNQYLAGFNIIIEADIYYSEPDCTFFIYKRKGTPLYSGMLQDSGKKFIASLFDRTNPYVNQPSQ